MNDIIGPVTEAYLNPGEEKDVNGHARIGDLCALFNLSNLKVRKLLVTAGFYQSTRLTEIGGRYLDAAEEVMKLHREGKSEEEIASVLSLSRSTVNSLLPYSDNGAYNLEEQIDGTRDISKASLASRRNKRYRKRKIVDAVREEEKRAAVPEPITDIDNIMDRLMEENDMQRCACCGKETLHLVRVGNNPDIGMCCEHCAREIMNVLKERRYKRKKDKESKADFIFTEERYMTKDGDVLSPETTKFQASDSDGKLHSFVIRCHACRELRIFDADEIYKVGKNGKKARNQPCTEYHFSVSGSAEMGDELIEKLIQLTAASVKYRTIKKEEKPWEMWRNVTRNNMLYMANETGTMEISDDYFIIDGETFSGDEIIQLFSSLSGWRINYQIVDKSSPALEKDMYLMPVKLNDETLLKELEEMLGVFSRGKDGVFICHENVPAFSVYFNKLLEKLMILYKYNRGGVGKIVGMKMIRRLGKVETDDDMFPEYQIKQIRETISSDDWLNHPEMEQVEEPSYHDTELAKITVNLDSELQQEVDYFLKTRKYKDMDSRRKWIYCLLCRHNDIKDTREIKAALGVLEGEYFPWILDNRKKLPEEKKLASLSLEEAYSLLYQDRDVDPDEEVYYL